MRTGTRWGEYVECPSCQLYHFLDFDDPDVRHFDMEDVFYKGAFCPSCGEGFIISVGGEYPILNEIRWMPNGTSVYHKARLRPPLPPQVPSEYRKDYREAVAVLHLSPKASAALSRRTLQHFLHTHRNIKGKSLQQEIEALLAAGNLPAYVSDVLDAVRNLGNFAAHPIPNVHTGKIIEVEPGEAEWLLEVLEKLFDFYFVQPEQARQKKEALNEKLRDAGKPPMK